ncbi:hypothetical protein M885DRAFT_589923 [Pelagophyceae sp. CCMP2097]|nr:hypothetical protein M885DRAFT_589923 [Pelagophyceae sp. CCMP2097]|mmetsp:Transcript_17218/g.58964  ORF Transcript_17218/g.58964 Transcript_17218/m.58964 type:complete len:308 (+) Transcript_17218:26-949(+)
MAAPPPPRVAELDAALGRACADARATGRPTVLFELDSEFTWELSESAGRVVARRARGAESAAACSCSLATFEALLAKELRIPRALLTGRVKLRGKRHALTKWGDVAKAAQKDLRRPSFGRPTQGSEPQGQVLYAPAPRALPLRLPPQRVCKPFSVKLSAKKVLVGDKRWRWELRVSAAGFGARTVRQDAVYDNGDAAAAAHCAATLRHELEWVGDATAAGLCSEAFFKTRRFDLPANLKVAIAWRKGLFTIEAKAASLGGGGYASHTTFKVPALASDADQRGVALDATLVELGRLAKSLCAGPPPER